MEGKIPQISQEDLKKSGKTQEEFDFLIEQYEQKTKEYLSSHGSYLKIENLEHKGFSDLMFLRWPWNKIAQVGNINPYKIIEIINKAIVQFLNKNLKQN